MTDKAELLKLLQSLSQEDIDSLIASKKEGDSDAKEQPKEKGKSTITEDFKVIRNNDNVRRRKVQSAGNSWTDTGEHREEDKIVKTISQRNRPKPSYVEVLCNVCGGRSRVPSSLPRTDYYRCEKCVGGG